MDTSDDDKRSLQTVGFTFTTSVTPYSSPRFHVHVEGPNFKGDKNAVVFDVDDEDLFRVAQHAVALAKEKYDATFKPD
ncbi:MAG TPA: hypothetical protein VK555_10245 [Terriglobales bacterium]|nr:hypothetical protein [Terriglobales bacterium]